MASVAPESKGRFGKRSFDAPVNLVPYIDLMTTIITFLMLTAVWIQMSALEVQNGTGGQESVVQKDNDDLPKPVVVMITDQGLKLFEEGGTQVVLPNIGDAYDHEGLRSKLKSLKENRPEREELKIKTQDGVTFEQIAKVIDIASEFGYSAVTLKPSVS